jgi:uncharacterized protein
MSASVRSAGKSLVLVLLQGYKWAVSPLLPPSCRYLPTCSEYAREAVQRYGALRGSWMAVARLLRCHPLAKGGYDPVIREKQDPRGWVRRDRREHARNQCLNGKHGFTR